MSQSNPETGSGPVNQDQNNASGCNATPATLQDLERVIEETEIHRQASYLEMGKALFEIQSRGLFKETHRTWQDYVMQRWGFTRQRAHQLMQAWLNAETSTAVDIAKTEWAARVRKAAQKAAKEAAKSSPKKTSSPQEPAKAGTIIDLTSSPQEPAKAGIVHSLDAEVEAFRQQVARWEKVLSSEDLKQLLGGIGRIIGNKLILLKQPQATAAQAAAA
jgi:hypothetical protein